MSTNFSMAIGMLYVMNFLVFSSEYDSMRAQFVLIILIGLINSDRKKMLATEAFSFSNKRNF